MFHTNRLSLTRQAVYYFTVHFCLEDAGKEDCTVKNIIRIKYDIILEKRNCL